MNPYDWKLDRAKDPRAERRLGETRKRAAAGREAPPLANVMDETDV